MRLKNILIVLAVLTLFAGILFSNMPTTIANQSETKNNIGPSDPWGQKEILNYLLCTADDKLQNDVKQLQQDLELTDSQMERLKILALQEHELIREKMQNRRNKSFNDEIKQTFSDIDNASQKILEGKYEDFRKWIIKWWNEEKKYRKEWLKRNRAEANGEIGTQASIDRVLVYATQYAGHTDYEVALPDKYIKFANIGWDDEIPDLRKPYYSNPPYTVNVYYEETDESVLDVEVREVGPWNEDDNYWDAADDANERRLFQDLDLGQPEAEEAFYNDYNNGENQFGDEVTNPAGIDLTPDVAEDLGLEYLENAWVWVRYSDLP
ncbi:MAG: hypothetical protein PWQ97_1270 [Tepidanaerobacteraceae bacterium]|nr:hypothetical protein [Tepidanaerobacteraceae bacterium]